MIKIGLLQLIFLTIMMSIAPVENVSAQNDKQLIRIAKLQIDSAQLDQYKAALKEAIEAAIRVEPGVLALYAVADKNNPTHVTVFEIYADEAAYKKHLETPHFKKYKRVTKDMVKSLELMDTEPIMIGTKSKE
jgi:4-carboxymuconolactone decarboxylase